MKKNIFIIIVLTIISLPLPAQRGTDALYLKNGSIIYGKLLEIAGNRYKIRTYDGSLFIFLDSEVEKLARESPSAPWRKSDGFGFGLETGFLAGPQNTDYDAPFSFNIYASYIIKTKSIISAGTGVEFIGVPFMPVYIEYKHLLSNKMTAPFLFARGGAMLHTGSDEIENENYYYNRKNFKGGFTMTAGTGVNFNIGDAEPYLSFAYRHAATSYQQRNYNNNDDTFKNNYNRLEVKFGFRF